MEDKEIAAYALLDSLFYLSQTEIPVRARYGENVVIYNHKNRMVLAIDKDGKSLLEGNGVYTVESLTSALVKGSVGVQEGKHSSDSAEKKSIFRSLIGNGTGTIKSKRVSMGVLPTLSPGIAPNTGGSQEIAPTPSRRPSLQPMSLFLAKSATTLDSDANKSASTLTTPHMFGKLNKGKRASNAEESLKAFVPAEKIKEDDDFDDEDSGSYDINQMVSSSGTARDSVQKSRLSSVSPESTTPEIVITPDKPKSQSKRKNSISRSSVDLLTKAFTGATTSATLSPEKLSPVRRGSSIPEIQGMKVKAEDVYNGILSTIIDSELRDVYVRVDETTLTVSNCAQNEIFLELDLKKAIATPKRSSTEFEFDFISPRLRQAFTAPTYLKMIEWMAVINSVASTLVIEPTGNMYSDMYADVFEREYRILLHQIETRDSNLTIYDVKFEPFLSETLPQKTEMLERSMFRINSADDGVIKYDPELPKTPFNIAGASVDKIVERLTDIYGPDQGFISLILHTYRCFTDSPTLLKKLVARMNPILKQNEMTMAGWKPVIKLRAISVIFKWMCLAWKPDFQNEAAKGLTVEFFNAISASFGNGTDQDKLMDTKYGPKFEIIKKSFQKRLGSSKRNSTMSQSGSNQTQSFQNRDSGMLRDSSPSVVKAAVQKVKVEFNAVETDAVVIALTDKEQGQLLQITPLTLLLHLWQSKEPLVLDLIKPINDMVESFNAMSFWVATEITTQPEMKNRIATVEKFIKIANHCFKLNNFNTTMAIVSGLNLNSVSRLKQTWELVEPKKKKQLERLEEIMTPLGNYKAYRAYVAEMDANCPHIPVVSLMLKDLLFAHDGNPTILPDKETKTLINYSKLKSIYDRVSIFSKLHHAKTFQIPKDTPGFNIAEEYCQNLRRLNEQQLYKYSLLCEPKVGDEHLNLRGKWMTQK